MRVQAQAAVEGRGGAAQRTDVGLGQLDLEHSGIAADGPVAEAAK